MNVSCAGMGGGGGGCCVSEGVGCDTLHWCDVHMIACLCIVIWVRHTMTMTEAEVLEGKGEGRRNKGSDISLRGGSLWG